MLIFVFINLWFKVHNNAVLCLRSYSCFTKYNVWVYWCESAPAWVAAAVNVYIVCGYWVHTVYISLYAHCKQKKKQRHKHTQYESLLRVRVRVLGKQSECNLLQWNRIVAHTSNSVFFAMRLIYQQAIVKEAHF